MSDSKICEKHRKLRCSDCFEIEELNKEVEELKEREKKLVRCLDEIETDSEISESDYKDAYLHIKEIARKTLKELGISNE